MSIISGFINSRDSKRNSKLITALFMVVVFTICSFLVMFGIPPDDSANVGTVLWVQGTIIVGALGVNAAESYTRRKAVPGSVPPDIYE